MIICGIDYSITSPAVAIFNGTDVRLYGWTGKKHTQWSNKSLHIDVCPYPEYTSEIERLSNLAACVHDTIMIHNPTHAFIEGYSFGGSGKVFNIAEGCGILKHKLWTSGIHCHDLSPGTVKKLATGAGNAKKPEMVEQFIKDTGVDIYDVFGKKKGLKTIPSPITDLVDAYYVAKWGLPLPVTSHAVD